MKSALYLRIEKYIIIALGLICTGATLSLGVLFYQSNAIKIPTIGGIYKEAMVGTISSLNPLFADFNEAEQDVSHLVFSGLTKYNPETKGIEEDIATYTISEDQKTYTFTLRENLFWHDDTPLTADDVVFTFRDVIQSPKFANEFLRQSFEGIVVSKVDDRTITFTLARPYAFFPAQLTTGLLPKHIWQDIPVEQYRDHVFNKFPIGNGPYKLTEAVQAAHRDALSITRVTLERYSKYMHNDKYMVQYVTFEAYPSEDSLLAHAKEYNGIKRISKEYKDIVAQETNLAIHTYTLPQYVSLSLNTESPLLKDSKLRLGLRLGTNKDALIEKYPDTKRIDTPFLELDDQSWFSQYDLEKANGALYDSGWKVKEGEQLLTDMSAVPPTPIEEEPVEEVESTVDETQETTNENEEETVQENLQEQQELEDSTTENPTEEDTTTVNTESAEAEENTSQESSIAGETSQDSSTITESTTEEESKNTLEETTDTSKEDPNTNLAASHFIIGPTAKETFKTNKNAVQISGILPPSTKEVFVNDYKLQQYRAGNTLFTYNTSVAIGNLKEGTNTFTVHTVDATDQKVLYDRITIIFDPTVSGDSSEGREPTNAAQAIAAQNEAMTKGMRPSVPVRYKDNVPLILTLVTRDTPPIYEEIATMLRQEYALLGIDLRVSILSASDMQKALDEKSYDILLFGQKLGYNLDAYPFWHSTQAGKGGVNFSNYQSFRANKLLEQMRTPTSNDPHIQMEERQKALKELQEIFAEDTPAIFLYQPLYYYGIDPTIQGVQLHSLAYHKDRFASMQNWFIQEKLYWDKGFSFGDLWNWLYKNLFQSTM